VLRIERSIHDAIIAHALKDAPDEACGLVTGPVGSGQPERFVPMTNIERSPTGYRFDDMEMFEVDDRDEEPVVVYHSHTATEAYPSRSDIGKASMPDAHYVIVSTRDTDKIEFRSYRIVDDVVTEEAVEIV
jgi:proteasome lid subunit RPN8/RPN11